MSSRFVEFNSYGGGSTFVNAEEVKAVVPSYAEIHGCTEIHLDEDAVLVTEAPAEVVAKLQQPEDSLDIPLCANHAETWFCDRPSLPHPDAGCVLCAFAAPPAESEAVQLLERVWEWWTDSDTRDSGNAICLDIKLLLAKLKGVASR